MDKNPAYPNAIKKLKAAEELTEIVNLRLILYFNNTVEQDHLGIKRESGLRRDSCRYIAQLFKQKMGFGSFFCGTVHYQGI